MLVVHTAGPVDGDLVVLLHGFPDLPDTWLPVVEPLTRAGFRLAMPALRGFGDSDAPTRVRAYRPRRGIADVAAVVKALDRDRTHIIGHDLGAALAWQIAAAAPTWLRRVVAVNGPHPAIWRRAVVRDPDQRSRAAYAMRFQIPGIQRSLTPDLLLGAYVDAGDAFTEGEMAARLAAWERPGRIASMLAWYRALGRARLAIPGSASIEAPLLLLWGDDDESFTTAVVDESLSLCRDGRLVRMPGIGHYPHRQAPQRVAAEAVAHLMGTS